MPVLIPQILSGIGWIIYGSFFEWYWHKFWMHEVRAPKEAFRGHAIVHHGLYKGDESFFIPVEEHPQHILLKPYALPAIVILHLPVVFLIQKWIPHTAIGGIVAMIGYFVVYEYMHWNMHVPRKQFVERFAWFQFLRNHHHLHHRHPMKNFCVLLPLADACLGTMVTEKTLAQRKAAREAAIAAGNIVLEGKKLKPAPDPNTLTGKIAISRAERAALKHYRQVEAVKKMLRATKLPDRGLRTKDLAVRTEESGTRTEGKGLRTENPAGP
jgi:hypothetical protein